MDNQIFSRIKKGDILPLFTLKNTKGEIISTDSFLRKKSLVVFFFNRIQDSCCSSYLEMLNSIYSELEEEGAEVLAVSQDKEDTLKEFGENKKIKFRLLFDSGGKVINKFTYKDNSGNNICALFITDKFQSLYKAYLHQPFGELPGKEEIISSVNFVEKQCPECGASTWPIDSE